MIKKRLIFLMMILIPALVPTLAPAQQTFTEDFRTTTYMDAVNTTANWDTSTGELKLFPYVPSLAGSCTTPDNAIGVTISGDHAFVASLSSGLQVINIEDSTDPEIIGSYDTPGSSLDVAVDGDYAFVADYSSLQVIDISDPENPALLGSYTTPGLAFGVAVAGDYAFVANHASGLTVIDISDPMNPTFVYSCNTTGFARAVALAGDHAFVADSTSGLQVIDISDPTTPTVIDSITIPDRAYDVAVSGNRAYVAGYSTGLWVVDIGDPSSPSMFGGCSTPDYAYGVSVSGDHAYVTAWNAGLLVIDISDPSVPSILHVVGTPGLAQNVAVSGIHAFVADDASGLQVVEISDPVPPTPIGSCATPGEAQGVAVSGNYAFVAEYAAGLQAFDISDPMNPVLAGGCVLSGNALEVAVSGDHAFVADSGFGLQVVDISDPTNPVLVGSYATSSSADGVAVSGNYAFVAEDGYGLWVIDISDPTNPVLADCYLASSAHDVAVSGNYAFVANNWSGLRVVDFSDPSALELAANLDTPGGIKTVAVSGDYAFVGDSNSGLQTIDISDPTNPVLTGNSDTLSNPRDVAVSGDHAFVADSTTGIQVFDIINPANPEFLYSYDTPGYAQGIAVSGEIVVVADHAAGLRIIQTRQSEFAPEPGVGQSLTLDESSDTIIRARITSMETAGINWEASADSGVNWSTLAADATWSRFNVLGNDLCWRSTHTWPGPGINPTVSDLTLEWLNEFGPINSVTDVPDDHGGWVRIDFTRSGYDFADEASLPVVGYYICRLVDEPVLLALIRDAEALAAIEAKKLSSGEDRFPWPLPCMKTTSIGDRLFVQAPASTSDRAGTLPPGTWEVVASLPAYQLDNYLANVPALAGTNTFLVTTHTTVPSEWFVSPTATGESIDNIAPAVPTSLLFSGPDTLAWDEAPEPDFGYHTVYGSENPVFDPSATLIGYTIDQSYDVSGSAHGYYHLTTSDHAGNESGAASIPSPTGTVSASMTCLPSSGTLPFTTSFSIELVNTYTGQSRRIAGRLDLALAGGGFYSSWRAGWTNVAPGGSYSIGWNQNLPAIGTLVGSNVFTLTAADVTPAPYNQPPYPAAGDTATALCTVVGNAP